MDSTDDGFHSGYMNGNEESLRQSLQDREQELGLICDHLFLSISSFGKTIREKLDKYSKNLVEKGLTEISRASITECHARQALKQDDLKAIKYDLYHLRTRYGHILEITNEMNTHHKKAIKSLQNETEKNKKNLETIQPFFSRPDNCVNGSDTIDGRTDLMRRAALAVKKLSERKPKQQQDHSSIPPATIGANVSSELEAKIMELERLNKQLEELGLQ